MYKLLNNMMIIYGIIDLLIQLSLRENARNGLFCSQLSLCKNGKAAHATVTSSLWKRQNVSREVLSSQRMYKTMQKASVKLVHVSFWICMHAMKENLGQISFCIFTKGQLITLWLIILLLKSWNIWKFEICSFT